MKPARQELRRTAPLRGALFLLISVLALMVFSVKSSGVTPQERSAEIINSGSTNTAGYRIIVVESGHVKYIPGKSRNRIGPPAPGSDTERDTGIPVEMARKFFADIDRASPLSNLPGVHCVKSVSFGTLTFVKFGDERSPDISCPADDPRITALYNDWKEILKAVKSKNAGY